MLQLRQMNRPRLIRGLRITWAVTCAIACVLLTVLWVRSYRYYDSLSYSFSAKAPEICWCEGLLHVGLMKELPTSEVGPLRVQTHRISRMERWQREIQYKHTNALGFGGINDSHEFVLISPFWCPWIVSGVCAALLWPSKTRSFTLRTLLIVTALLAAVLSLAVCAARK